MATLNGTSIANTLNGTANADTLDGKAGNDTLNGGNGNDTLIGGTGNDSMTGGAGNDVYVVDAVNDKVVEASGAGTDTVQASVTYTLTANVEKLILTGSANLNGTGNTLANTLTGNNGRNRLSGANGNDTLAGAGGNDTLDGGAGNDSMMGGAGNDLYLVNATADKTNETGGSGTDTVQSSVTFTAAAGIENLVLTGSANINATGNTGSNVLTGNSGNNTLTGQGGNDRLDGGNGNDILDGGAGGADTLLGGGGNDTLAWDAADARADGGAGADTLKLTGTQTLNLAGKAGTQIANIEVVNLSGTNALTLSAANVLAMSTSSNTLRIDGAAGDTVTATDDWVAAGTTVLSTVTYNVFTSGAATLQVQQGVTFTDPAHAAVIGGDVAGSVTEDGSTSTSGTLTVTDADGAGEESFVAQTGNAGSYGSFGVDAAGAWTYELDNAGTAVQGLAGGETVTDTFTVSSADGTTEIVTITVTGANDAAVIGGTLSVSVGEDDGPAGGTATVADADAGESLLVAESPNADHGVFSVAADGTWSYTPDVQAQALGAGETAVDTLTIYSADGGTTETLTVTISGVNDAAAIGNNTGSLGEDDTAAGGTLVVIDVDGADTLEAQTDSTGDYGLFSVAADGAWSYDLTADLDGLGADESATDTFTVTADDGTTQTFTVSIHGANDAAVIGGNAGSLGENDTSTGGVLSINDADGEDEEAFASGWGLLDYGDYTVNAAGTWDYDLTADMNGLGAGESAIDTFTVTSVDGTTQTVTVTINGANDAAVFGGDVAGAMGENDGPESGTLTVSDADTNDADTVQAQTASVGTYGLFSIDTAGAWTYTIDTDLDYMLPADSVSDTFAVVAADGVTQNVTITIHGVNDAALISGDASGAVTEDTSASDSGQLTSVDLDHSSFFGGQTDTLGSYGLFSMSATGLWTYDLTAQGLGAGDTATDTFTVWTEDGTTASVTIAITGANDAPTVATNTGVTVAEGEQDTVITALMLNEGDVDDAGAGLMYTLTDATDSGTLYRDGVALGVSDTFTQQDIVDGIVTYDHGGGEAVADAFGFTLADGGENGAGTASGTFDITILPDSTYVLAGGPATIELWTIPGGDIRTVDITGSDDNTLTLSLNQVLGASAGVDYLYVDGNAGDTVEDTEDTVWEYAGNDGTYDVYYASDSQLMIDMDITHDLILM